MKIHIYIYKVKTYNGQLCKSKIISPILFSW